ncbi:MAG: NAD-dependent protein deacylase, partial [Erysipelotrichaceae bacterium]|nr:NAD-dependent protein deacylase [Erysipelotrichaceae bacterium]
KILEEGVPHCTCGGLVKPDVVLYEEALKDADILDAIHSISEADTLIVGGTSLAVYPAAGMLRYFRGNTLILINKSETPMDHQADIVIHDALGNVMSQLRARLDKEDNM